MGNAGICAECGGKGWIWTGEFRALCHGCFGDGHARKYEDRAKRGTMPQVKDPSRG